MAAELPDDEALAIRVLAESFFASGDDFTDEEVEFVQHCMSTLDSAARTRRLAKAPVTPGEIIGLSEKHGISTRPGGPFDNDVLAFAAELQQRWERARAREAEPQLTRSNVLDTINAVFDKLDAMPAAEFERKLAGYRDGPIARAMVEAARELSDYAPLARQPVDAAASSQPVRSEAAVKARARRIAQAHFGTPDGDVHGVSSADSQRLDFMLRESCVMTRTRDSDYWGVMQVFDSEGTRCANVLVTTRYASPREAIDAARAVRDAGEEGPHNG